jgi:hypothetical protein
MLILYCDYVWYEIHVITRILTGHSPVRGHLYTMGLFEGDPICRFCRKKTETVQHIICCCESLACHLYNVFGNLLVEPKDISTAPVGDLCLFIIGTGLPNLCCLEYLGLHNKPKAEVYPGHKLTVPIEEEEEVEEEEGVLNRYEPKSFVSNRFAKRTQMQVKMKGRKR